MVVGMSRRTHNQEARQAAKLARLDHQEARAMPTWAAPKTLRVYQ
jgi:hypothetical protein